MDVSIIVPLYKGKKFINTIVQMIEKNREYILNTSKEKETQIEIIFVNDYPFENIIESDIPNSRISIILITNENNYGIHKSRVNGLNRASGEYLLFLDQDDTIEDNYLESQLECIKDADAVLCNGIFRGNKRIYSDMEFQKKVTTKEGYLNQKNIIISPGQVLLKKNVIPKVWINNILKENGSDDVLLWVLLLNNHIKWEINFEQLYVHIEESNNTSFNFKGMKKSVEELIYIIENKNFLTIEDTYILIKALKNRIKKYNKYIEVLNDWETIIVNLIVQIKSNNYKIIALYGYGIIGKKLLFSLQASGIKIDVIIDKDAQNYQEKDKIIYTLEQVDKMIDMVIVTPLFEKDKILLNLKLSNNFKKVISIDEVL